MSELERPIVYGQLEKPVDVLCHSSFPGLPFSMRAAQRFLVLPLVTIAAVGIALYLYSVLLPFLVIPLALFTVDTAVSFKPFIQWVNEGIKPVANVLLAVPLLSLPLVLPVLMVTAWLQGIATHIRLGNAGFWFSGQLSGMSLSTSLIPWSALATLNALQKIGENDQALELNILKGNLSWRTWVSLWFLCPAVLKSPFSASLWKLRIPLSSLSSELDLERLILAFCAALPEGAGASLLGLSPAKLCPTYTELWLEGLSPETRSDVLSEGTTIGGGKYVIDQIIGSGGEGVVYSGKRLNSDLAVVEPVAVKEFVLPVQGGFLCVARALEHIERENILVKRLSHPGIIKLLDYFVEDNRVYLVLELLEGKTLQSLVEEKGALSEDYVIDLSIQMCEILQYLHSQEPAIVHRDFTPDNLMLLPGGTLKLIDFNVAQQLEATSTQTIVGKQSFIPPEQFRGKATDQSDLYALGATMNFLLTGEEPEPITVSRPRLTNPRVSFVLDAIVAQLTQQDVAERSRRAESVLEELHACQTQSNSVK